MAIKRLLDKRETVIAKNKDRKHFRNNLGEFRFGKKGEGRDINEFYDMLRKGKGKDCNF